MKTKFTLLALFCAVKITSAQLIPNAGFENWFTVGTHLEPNDWKLRVDALGNYSGIQTTDKNSGNYAINVRNILSGTDTLRGVVTTVKPADLNEGAHPVFAVSSRHTSLNYFYKYSSVNNDSAQVVIVMFKTGYVGPFGPGICGYSFAQHFNASSYTFGSSAITYFDGTVIPDSAWIALASYKETDPITFSSLDPLGNSNLFVDDMNFDMLSVNDNLEEKNMISVMPNPASDVLQITSNEIEGNYTISLYNAIGKRIETLASSQHLSLGNTLTYNVSAIPNGTYMLVVANEKNYSAKKIIVQH